MTLTVPLGAQSDVDSGVQGDVPLVEVMRGDYVGSLHRGVVAVTDLEGNVPLALGNPSTPAFLRSAAKPFQVMPAVLGGGPERYGITTQELAVLCGSHGGERRHREAVLSVLTKTGLDESFLQCGVHPPLDEQSARALWRSRSEPTPVCHNCSGAHAGMLLACRTYGWPLENYGSLHHPLQVETLRVVSAFAGVPMDTIQIAVDNCAVPTFRLPLNRSALAFARLVTGEGVSGALAGAASVIRSAMTTYPEMVGGDHRFDTDLMRVAGGSILSKGGAEGFAAMGLARERVGIAVKISDGNSRAIPPVALCILTFLRSLDDTQLDSLRRLLDLRIHSHLGELVGRLVPAFRLGGTA